MSDDVEVIHVLMPVSLGEVKALARNSRAHWTARAEATGSVRHAANVYARQGDVPRPVPWERSDVHVLMRVRDRYRRDPDNISGPAKAILDGLVDAGLLVDDGPEHVRRVSYELASGCEFVRKGVAEFLIRLTSAD